VVFVEEFIKPIDLIILHNLIILYSSSYPFKFFVFSDWLLVTVSRLVLRYNSKKLIKLLLGDVQKVYFLYLLRHGPLCVQHVRRGFSTRFQSLRSISHLSSMRNVYRLDFWTRFVKSVQLYLEWTLLLSIPFLSDILRSLFFFSRFRASSYSQCIYVTLIDQFIDAYIFACVG